MLKAGEKCPVCGEGVLESRRIREEFEYKGHKLGLDINVYSCGLCGEEFYDDEEMKQYQKTIKDFQRSVDGLLISDEIREIRKALRHYTGALSMEGNAVKDKEKAYEDTV